MKCFEESKTAYDLLGLKCGIMYTKQISIILMTRNWPHAIVSNNHDHMVHMATDYNLIKKTQKNNILHNSHKYHHALWRPMSPIKHGIIRHADTFDKGLAHFHSNACYYVYMIAV